MKQLFTFLCCFLMWVGISGQAPAIEWQKVYGGPSRDVGNAILQTSDHGYILAGSFDHNDANLENHRWDDYWVLKLQPDGNKDWEKYLGGPKEDFCFSIVETNDGNFILAGYSEGDSLGNNNGFGDYGIYEINSQGGVLWERMYGGLALDAAYSIIQTFDLGFIATGRSNSFSGFVTGNHGSDDYWVLKLTNFGVLAWQKCFGGTKSDLANSIQQTIDGGFIIAGSSKSSDGDVSENHGDYDFWIVKLSSAGNLEWQQSLGGINEDRAAAIRQTNDSGYIIVGYTKSTDGDVSNNHGSADYWVVKLNKDGDLQWQKCLGGSKDDRATSVEQTNDGGYIVSGYISSIDGDILESFGAGDAWIVKLDATGITQWQKTIGGTLRDYIMDIKKTADGGYILAGYTNSNTGEFAENKGVTDVWVVKLATDVTSVHDINYHLPTIVYPNPCNELLTINFPDLQPENDITITNLLGEILSQEKAIGSKTEIDVSHLPSGMYFVNNRKFVKE